MSARVGPGQGAPGGYLFNELGVIFPLETIVQSSFAAGNNLLKTVEQLVRSSA